MKSDNARGALVMMVSMAAFTINDAFMKSLSDELPLFQAIFIRGVAASGFLAVLALIIGRLRFNHSPRDWGRITLRSLSEVAAAYFFITALYNMPLANATAILQALPLMITLCGALFLREAVGWRRITAILIGFCGVMLIIQPGAQGFNVYSLYALASVIAVTVRDLATRKLSADVPSLTVAFVASVWVTMFAAIGCAVGDWVPMSTRAAVQLSASTLFLILGYICSVIVMRLGDISVIAPFRYTSLIWALLIGIFAFDDWPDAYMLTGALIVTLTGIFTLVRERHIKRPKTAGLRTR